MIPSPTEPDRPRAAYNADSRPPMTGEKRRNRRKVLWTIAAAAVVGTAAILVYRARTAERAGPGFGGPGGTGRGRGGFGSFGPLPVVASAARAGDINIVLKGLGTVTPLATITVRTQISGYLAEVKFTEGQWVNKGDVLAVIDPRPYQATLEQAQGQLLQAQSLLGEAQIDLDRYTTLAAQDSISKQQVDAQRALVMQYEGMVKQDQGIVDNAQLNVAYCHVTAPVSGRVGLRLVDPGNYVTPADASGLVLLTQLKPITVIFTLPEDNIPDVLKQLRSGAKIPVDAYNRDSSRKLATGTLSTVDNTVDPTTGMFKLRALFANEDESLFPDQFVNAAMLLDVEHGATVVPTSAIERGQQGPFVYVVGPDNHVSARNVKLGATEGERVAVVSGISVADVVVVDGADRLRDGMEVVPKAPAQPGAAAAAPARAPGQGQWQGRGQGQGQNPGGDRKRWKPGGGS